MGMEPEMDDESCYAILGVDPSASTSQIRQVRENLARTRQEVLFFFLQRPLKRKVWTVLQRIIQGNAFLHELCGFLPIHKKHQWPTWHI